MHLSHSTADCIAFQLTRDVSQFSNLIKKVVEKWQELNAKTKVRRREHKSTGISFTNLRGEMQFEHHG